MLLAIPPTAEELEAALRQAITCRRPTRHALVSKLLEVHVPFKRTAATAVMHLAALKGDVVMLVLLQDRGADLSSTACREGGDTAMHMAARRGFVTVMHMLLAAGAPVDSTNSSNGTTPLHAAAAAGQLAACELLLQHGADVNVMCQRGETALYKAIAYATSCEQLQRLLLRAGGPAGLAITTAAGRTLLHAAAAASMGQCCIVPDLVAQGVAVEAKDSDGMTALHLAAASGKAAMAAHLVSYAGASVSRQDHRGWTAARYAMENNHMELAGRLVTGAAAAATAPAEDW